LGLSAKRGEVDHLACVPEMKEENKGKRKAGVHQRGGGGVREKQRQSEKCNIKCKKEKARGQPAGEKTSQGGSVNGGWGVEIKEPRGQ